MSRFKGPNGAIVEVPSSSGDANDGIGKILISLDGFTFSAEFALASDCGGWITNDNGYLLVVG